MPRATVRTMPVWPGLPPLGFVDGCAVTVAVGEGETVTLGDGDGDAAGEGEGIGVGVGVTTGVGVTPTVGVGVIPTVGVGVGIDTVTVGTMAVGVSVPSSDCSLLAWALNDGNARQSIASR